MFRILLIGFLHQFLNAASINSAVVTTQQIYAFGDGLHTKMSAEPCKILKIFPCTARLDYHWPTVSTATAKASAWQWLVRCAEADFVKLYSVVAFDLAACRRINTSLVHLFWCSAQFNCPSWCGKWARLSHLLASTLSEVALQDHLPFVEHQGHVHGPGGTKTLDGLASKRQVGSKVPKMPWKRGSDRSQACLYFVCLGTFRKLHLSTFCPSDETSVRCRSTSRPEVLTSLFS